MRNLKRYLYGSSNRALKQHQNGMSKNFLFMPFFSVSFKFDALYLHHHKENTAIINAGESGRKQQEARKDTPVGGRTAAPDDRRRERNRSVVDMSNFQEIFKRIEIKYLLDETTYMRLRERLKGMAEVDRYGESTILNIYYDTPDYRLIRTSLDKPDYKEKLRLRSYNTPTKESPAFIEIKKKYDGVVYKRRIDMKYDEALGYLAGSGDEVSSRLNRQIKNEIDYMRSYYGGLQPMMVISYDRIAMFGKEDPELRITFDRNIRYRTDRLDLRYGGSGKDLLKPGQRLMEVKIAGAFPLELARIFSELRIYPVSFSKYGRGYVNLMTEKCAARLTAVNDYKYDFVKEKGAVAYAG